MIGSDSSSPPGLFSNLKLVSLNGNRLNALSDCFIQFINEKEERRINLLDNSFKNEYVYVELKSKILNLNKINLFNKMNDSGHLASTNINFLDESNKSEWPHLANFEWQKIPMFSAITGKNGIGKTSVLKLIEKILHDEFIRSDSDKFNDFLFPIYLQVHQSILVDKALLGEYEYVFSNKFSKKRKVKLTRLYQAPNKKPLGHCPMCLQASPFLALVAAGVPAGRPEERKPAFQRRIEGECDGGIAHSFRVFGIAAGC